MAERKENPPGIHLWLVLSKASKALEAHAQHSIQGLGICVSDFAVLEILLHRGPMPVNALGKKVLLTSGSMTAAVDRLKARGFVERCDDPADRRARIVHLTPAGEQFIRALFKQHAGDMERAVSSSLTPDEIATVTAILKKLGKGAESLLERK